MKRISLKLFGLALLVSCSSGGGNTSNDQNSDPETDADPTPTNSKVECLKKDLSDLPSDMKKVIELSANAVIKCKASRSDVESYLRKRKI